MSDLLFPVMILAGGLATRLRPITEKIPKSLIEVNQKPFIFHQLKLLAEQNIKEVILCVGFLGEQIQDYVGDGKDFGLHVKYAYDGDVLLGTGGAIQKAIPLLSSDHFFVLYGDSYLPCDFLSVQKSFISQQKKSLMTVFHNNGQWDSSNVIFKQGKILMYDKKIKSADMHYIDYGLGVFNQTAFSNNTQKPFDLAELYQQLLVEHQLAGYEVFNRFYEVGSFNGISELENFL